MKGAIALVLLSLTCSACGRSNARATPSQAYRSWSDKLAVAVGLSPFSCTHKVKDKFGEYYASIPKDQCVKFDPPQRWHGFWRDDFEGSVFCPAAATTCGYVNDDRRSQPLIWLDVERVTKKPANGALYAVDLIGHRSAYKGSYGHMGMFDHDLIVDRFISVKPVEPPAKK